MMRCRSSYIGPTGHKHDRAPFVDEPAVRDLVALIAKTSAGFVDRSATAVSLTA